MSNLVTLNVLQHESGLAWFSKPIPSVKDAWTENIKQNKIGEFIQEQKQKFPASSTNGATRTTEYHALTRGMIVNELVRRIDPEVRSKLKEYHDVWLCKILKLTTDSNVMIHLSPLKLLEKKN